MSENLEGEKRAPDWSNDGMDSVPDRINPGNFICEKFEQKKNAGNNHDAWLAQDRERLILWGKNDPVEMNGKASGENRQVKISPARQASPSATLRRFNLSTRNYRCAETIVTCELQSRSNDEPRMTNDEIMTKWRSPSESANRILPFGLVIPSSFDIRQSSFHTA